MTYDTNGHAAFDEREIIELTIRACLPNLTDGEVHLLRERVSHGIFSLKASCSKLTADPIIWGYDDTIRMKPILYDIVRGEVKETLHNITQVKIAKKKICNDLNDLKNLHDE